MWDGGHANQTLWQPGRAWGASSLAGSLSALHLEPRLQPLCWALNPEPVPSRHLEASMWLGLRGRGRLGEVMAEPSRTFARALTD